MRNARMITESFKIVLRELLNCESSHDYPLTPAIKARIGLD